MHILQELDTEQQRRLLTELMTEDPEVSMHLFHAFLFTPSMQLATNLKQKASEILLQDQEEEDDAKPPQVDPNPVDHLPTYLPQISAFLDNNEILKLECLSRRSFISLRNYPAITRLGDDEFCKYLKHCKKHSVAPDLGRFRNVRDLELISSEIYGTLCAGSATLYKGGNTAL